MTKTFSMPLILPALLGLGTLVATARAQEATAEGIRFFEAEVRPILVDHCQKCHGPDKQRGGLRLDARESALAGGDTGAAIEPGKPGESLLVQAVMHRGEAPKMPPSKKLDSKKAEALAKWVEIGAPWPHEEASAPTRKPGMTITDKDRNHWAFRPIRKAELPKVKDASWVLNPIDAFVLAKLEDRHLGPSPPASKRALIRRATYDLTGLPPSPEEVDRFVAETDPRAYENLVDRLLASPRYGEKWGRHWLDLVRFAETNSYERDGVKPSAWRYRDYAIRSLNDDKPYDRFVREQLAGDEMADRSPETVAATGYYRLGVWDDEPVDREQAEFDSLDDIVATTSQVFLGLTVDCARCHDHRLDPIPQKDYYKLLSFFRNITPYRNGGPTDELPYVEPGREADAAKVTKELEEKRVQVAKAIASLEGEYRKRSGDFAPDASRKPDIEDLRYRFYRDTFERLPEFAALKAEDVGELPRGLFDLAPRTRDDAFGFVFEGQLVVPKAGEYAFTLDSDDGSRLTIGGTVAIDHDGVHGEGDERSATVNLPEGRAPIVLEYFQKGNGLGLTVSWSGPDFTRVPLSASLKDRPKAPTDLAARIRNDGAKVLGPERMERYRQLKRQLAEIRRGKTATDSILRVTERGPNPPDTFVLVRGNAHVPGDKVEPGFLAVLGSAGAVVTTPPPGSETSFRRTALADWVTSADNPLTARVMANRLFQHHFGRGIVRSPNNFGLQGDKPTHPELLDWLASELIAGGWKLKPLHRTIMLSNTYRMSSRPSVEAFKIDPTNDLLWRFDMRRLTAEEVRDSVLAVSGCLNLKMYGPGVYPEIPREVLAGQSVPGAGWVFSPPEEQSRRSVYVHVKRSLLLPILEGFDLAETDRSSPNRFSTTQPTQALGMLNGEFLGSQAAKLAERCGEGDDATLVKTAFRLVTGRDATEAEVTRGVGLIADWQSRDHMSHDSARKTFCLLALNLNEFLYLD